jgi:hypothetical protein
MTEHYNELLSELKELEQEHLDLNQLLDNRLSKDHFSEFTIQKLKKRKLLLKDKIKKLKDLLCPDIIA